jgi:hypothetical protein
VEPTTKHFDHAAGVAAQELYGIVADRTKLRQEQPWREFISEYGAV